MSRGDDIVREDGATPTDTTSEKPISTRLRGPWLAVARVMWVVLAVLTLLILIAGIPVLYNVARDSQPEVEPTMVQFGLSGNFFVVFIVVFSIIPVLVFALAAAILFLLRSDDWMVMFVALTPLMFWAFFSPGTFYLVETHSVWHPPIFLLQVMGPVYVILLFYLFPNGRFVPRWTRVAAGVLAAGWLVSFFLPHSTLTSAFDSILLIGSIGAGVFAQVYRYTRVSTPGERQQTKWPLLSLLLSVLVLGVGVPVVFFFDFGRLDLIMAMAVLAVTVLVLSFIPLSLGISILRYRLWDIDFLINRSLVYGALTTLLVAFFGLSTFVTSKAFQNFAGGPLVAVAVSAALFGAVFQPARRRIQYFVDRRFYGIQIDYQKTPLSMPGPGEMTSVLRQTHFSTYRDLELIGRGGMAEVYRAIHPTLGRPVAIKLLPARLAAAPDFCHRFQREAQVVSQLQHPNIVRVFDFGEEGGTHYIVMEYLIGKDLAHYLREVGRLSLAQAMPILRDVASALDYAHARGLVHRDIKPSNVMLDQVDQASAGDSRYRVVLMDFGVAKIVGGQTMLTRTGMLGTFDYIAPEQIQTAAEVDGRADVYALGVMVYQMLTGELPFKRNNPGALLIAHLTQPPPDPRECVLGLSRKVAHALRRAMAKSSEERYRTAGEFVQALR